MLLCIGAALALLLFHAHIVSFHFVSFTVIIIRNYTRNHRWQMEVRIACLALIRVLCILCVPIHGSAIRGKVIHILKRHRGQLVEMANGVHFLHRHRLRWLYLWCSHSTFHFHRVDAVEFSVRAFACLFSNFTLHFWRTRVRVHFKLTE